MSWIRPFFHSTFVFSADFSSLLRKQDPLHGLFYSPPTSWSTLPCCSLRSSSSLLPLYPLFSRLFSRIAASLLLKLFVGKKRRPHLTKAGSEELWSWRSLGQSGWILEVVPGEAACRGKDRSIVPVFFSIAVGASGAIALSRVPFTATEDHRRAKAR